jgi:hypothetical protein
MDISPFAFLFFILLFLCIFQNFQKDNLKEISNLDHNGYVIKHNIISKDKMDLIKNYWDKSQYKEIDNIIKNDIDIKDFINRHIKLNDYQFMDYIMFLENSVVHTCHRDNNSHYFNNTKPSYTIILYIDDMQNCLDVIPKSHKHKIGLYLYDKTRTFLCKNGSIILFDSSLIHCGSIFSKDNNRRIQLKVSHKDDLENLSFYQNYHKIINKPNTNSKISKSLQKQFSCTFPFLSDITQGSDKKYISSNISPLAKMFSKLFYSDSNYYKLQNAW